MSDPITPTNPGTEWRGLAVDEPRMNENPHILCHKIVTRYQPGSKRGV